MSQKIRWLSVSIFAMNVLIFLVMYPWQPRHADTANWKLECVYILARLYSAPAGLCPGLLLGAILEPQDRQRRMVAWS